MKLLSAEEALSLTDSDTVEEFMIKKDLIKRGPFNSRDSYDLISIFVAQRKEKLAWKLFEKKIFTINSWFYWHNFHETGRQRYIVDGMERFANVYAKKAWPSTHSNV